MPAHPHELHPLPVHMWNVIFGSESSNGILFSEENTLERYNVSVHREFLRVITMLRMGFRVLGMLEVEPAGRRTWHWKDFGRGPVILGASRRCKGALQFGEGA